MANHTVDALWRWSEGGELPVVIDASSCTLGLPTIAAPLLSEINAERHARLRVLDSIAWARDACCRALRVDAQARRRRPSIRPARAATSASTARSRAIAAALADEVVVPIASTCCGFAGDRGLLHPELTAAATADEAAEIAGRDFDAHLCSNRTCEIGLQQGTGRPYESFVFALEELTAAAG